MTLADKLRNLRSKSKESLQAVADAIGVSKAHVWELETGRSQNPSIDMLQRLAKHFGVTVAYLADAQPLEKARAESFFRRNQDRIEAMSDDDLAQIQSLVERFSGKP